LQRRRKKLFARQPWCVLCLEGVPHEEPVSPGTRTRATIRDHRIPLAEGGRDDETNEQAICDDHNRAKTRRESERGLRRSR
jgi:5-methylcytosine-specific restriction enzyme A